MRVARPVRRAGRGDGPVERPAPRLGPTPTPSTRRGKARFTAPSSSTSSAGGSSAGRSIRCRPPPWSPTPWACAQAWRSSSANPTGPLSTRTVHPVHLVGVHPARARLRPHALHGLGRGLPVDNAVIESFWSRMQVELLDRRQWRTRVELANAIFEYLEIFHNRQRRHSALGMLTPVEFETRHQSATVA
jgi:hypothetical protein